jgi:phytol kinase
VSPALQIALLLASVAVLLGLMAVVRALSGVWGFSSEVQRKLVHIGTGLYALTLPWLFPDRWPIYGLLGLTVVVMLVLRRPGSRLGQTLHGVERQSYGDLLLALSVGLCLFLAGDRLYLYVLPIAVLTLSDAFAALAGKAYGSIHFTVEEGQKSVEGSAVFFAITLLISFVCLMLMTDLAPLNIIVLSLMVASFGAYVEALSWRGFDNMFLPLGLLIFLTVHAEDSLADLAALVVLFALSVLAFNRVAAKIGLSKHAARVYVVAVFLLLAVTEVQNAIFPLLVLGAHAWCRKATPCTAKYPDLDIVAALALVSFGWLALGNATQWNAVSFYGLTTMGLMIGLCALALKPQSLAVRIVALMAIVAGVLVLRAAIINVNPAPSNWNGPIWALSVISAVGMAIIPSIYPSGFVRARVTKLTLLALAIPLLSYLYAIDISGLWT